MKKLRWLYALLFLVALGLILYPAQAAAGAVAGLRMCGTAVIPALFPFFVLTRFLIALLKPPHAGKRLQKLTERLFGVGSACIPAILLSFIGGYPVGVSTVVSLYESGAISKRDAQRALVFCNNSGPAFFVGIIGNLILKSVRQGLLLYLIHCFCALLCGIFLARPSMSGFTLHRSVPAVRSPAQAFQDAVAGSCAAMLQISGLVILFSVLLSLLSTVGVFNILTQLPGGLTVAETEALVCGFLELSGGMLRLAGSGRAFVLCALLMGWGGLCVHMQAMSLWQTADLHPSGYFVSKVLHGLLSALFAAAFAQKTTFSLLCVLCVCGLCVIFPRIRQKWCGNPEHLAV